MAPKQDEKTPIFAETLAEIGRLPEVDVPDIPPEFAESLAADAFGGGHRKTED